MDARHDHMGRIPAGCDILGPMFVAAPLEAAVSSPAIGGTTLPSDIAARTHLSRLRAATSGTGDIRIRPIPVPATSAAITTIAFLWFACR